MTHNRLQKKPPNLPRSDQHFQTELSRAASSSQGDRGLMEKPPIKKGSPWGTYEPLYNIHLDENDPVSVAEEKGRSFGLFDIRRSTTITNDQITMLRNVRHPNFVTVHEIYQVPNGYYVVFDHMTRSLQEAAGNPHLDSARLAAIVGQVCPFSVSLPRAY